MLPDEIKMALLALIVLAVTDGLKVVSNWFGKDLTGYASAIAAGIAGSIIVFAEALLSLIPVQYQPIAASAFTLIVTLLGAFGAYRLMKRMRPIAAG